MNGSQIYIGTQNGVVVCVDSRKNNQLTGRFYHSYSLEASYFEDLSDLLFRMEALFDELRFPFPSTNERLFTDSPANAVPAD